MDLLQGPSARPRGTRLDADPSCLSLLSYNLLAPAFVRPIDVRTGTVQPYALFQWAEPAAEVLDWAARQPRLLSDLQASGADVICLQEVQFEVEGEDIFVLPHWLRLAGYQWLIPGQTYLQTMAERNRRVLDHFVAIGCVVLYRADRLDVVGQPPSNCNNTLVGLCLRGREGTAIDGLGPTAVFCVHLDATSEEKRVDQLTRLLGTARSFGTRDALIAGDMNTEMLEGSCVGAFLRREGDPEPSAESMAKECASALRLGSAGEDEEEDEEEEAAPAKKAADAAAVAGQQEPSADQLEAWRALWRRSQAAASERRIALARAPTGPTRAAYDHGCDCGPCVTWRLDHVLFTTRTLDLLWYWETLEADPESAAAGLPNRAIPSDHHPVASVFRTRSAPCLSDAEAAELLSRVEALEAQQATAREELQRELDAAEPWPTGPDNGGKKAKTKREKPPPEVIAHIQERRRRTREQKEVHAAERAALVAGLGDLDFDVLEPVLGDLPTWAETGTRGQAA